ncbi:hypothetical protein ACHAO1_010922 [Botrytis cinerea]
MVVAKVRIVQKHCVKKNGEAGLISCPIDFASSRTPPLSLVPTKDEAAPIRRVSERLSSNQEKRSYSTIQTTINERRKFKRRKASVPEHTDSGTATSESIPYGRTIEDCISTEYDIDELLSTTNSAVSSSPKSAAAETLADDTYRQSPEEIRSPADKERINNDEDDCTQVVDYDDGMNILEGYFSQPLESGNSTLILRTALVEDITGANDGIPLKEVGDNTDDDDDDDDDLFEGEVRRHPPEYYLAAAASLDVGRLRQKRYSPKTQIQLDTVKEHFDHVDDEEHYRSQLEREKDNYNALANIGDRPSHPISLGYDAANNSEEYREILSAPSHSRDEHKHTFISDLCEHYLRQFRRGDANVGGVAMKGIYIRNWNERIQYLPAIERVQLMGKTPR